MDWSSIALNVVASITAGGSIAAIITAISNRPKVAAETEESVARRNDTIVKTATELVESLRQEVMHVRQEMRAMQDQFAMTEASKRKLESKVSVQETEIRRLSVILRSYRARVEYLTSRIVESRIDVTEWTPPGS